MRALLSLCRLAYVYVDGVVVWSVSLCAIERASNNPFQSVFLTFLHNFPNSKRKQPAFHPQQYRPGRIWTVKKVAIEDFTVAFNAPFIAAAIIARLGANFFSLSHLSLFGSHFFPLHISACLYYKRVKRVSYRCHLFRVHLYSFFCIKCLWNIQ